MRNDIYLELAKKGLVCGICGKSLEKEWKEYMEWRANPKSHKFSKININIDHIIPKSLYSTEFQYIKNNLCNLQLSHKSCNTKKNNKLSTLTFT